MAPSVVLAWSARKATSWGDTAARGWGDAASGQRGRTAVAALSLAPPCPSQRALVAHPLTLCQLAPIPEDQHRQVRDDGCFEAHHVCRVQPELCSQGDEEAGGARFGCLYMQPVRQLPPAVLTGAARRKPRAPVATLCCSSRSPLFPRCCSAPSAALHPLTAGDALELVGRHPGGGMPRQRRRVGLKQPAGRGGEAGSGTQFEGRGLGMLCGAPLQEAQAGCEDEGARSRPHLHSS